MVMSHASIPPDSRSDDEREVCALYRQVLDCWNMRNAGDFAAAMNPAPTAGANCIDEPA